MIRIFSAFSSSNKPKIRGSKWRALRQEVIAQTPYCEICGSTKNLEVHHFYDVSHFPHLELQDQNLIVLCDGSEHYKGLSCHRIFGHLGDWKKTNYNLRSQLPTLRDLLFKKPKRRN